MTHPPVPAYDVSPESVSERTTSWWKNRDATLCAIILLVAVVARVGALWKYGDALRDDPDAYRVIASNLSAGRGYSLSESSAPSIPTAYRPPLYPCLLTVVDRVSATDKQLSARMLGGIQLLLGTGTVWLTMLCARRLFSSPAPGWPTYFAGLIVAVDPLSVYGTPQVMTETMATFLATLSLFMGLNRTGDGGHWLVRAAGGAAFGLSCLCRPTFWAFGAMVALVWLWRLARSSKSREVGAGRRIRSVAVPTLLGAALVVAPWVIRNAITMGRPILTTTHGGYTLLLGHNPFYTKAVVDRPWGAVWEISADRDWEHWLTDGLTQAGIPVERVSPEAEFARDRWMSARAWQYLREEPSAFVRSSLTLVLRFWNVVPLTTTNRTTPNWVRYGIGGFYIILYSLTALGLWNLRREEWLPWMPFLVLIVSFTAVHSLYWSDMRMRAPLVPAIALLATRGIVAVCSAKGRHNAQV